jgi:hypothetical protein
VRVWRTGVGVDAHSLYELLMVKKMQKLGKKVKKMQEIAKK